jgi:hypothetical protein
MLIDTKYRIFGPGHLVSETVSQTMNGAIAQGNIQIMTSLLDINSISTLLEMSMFTGKHTLSSSLNNETLM